MENLFYNERPLMTTVYFEPRDHLNQHMNYLHRAKLITFRQGQAERRLTRQMTTAIARRVGWTGNEYEIYKCSPTHFIVICQGQLNRDEVVRSGPYTIEGTEIEFDVQARRVEFNMTYFPHSFKTWITLRNAPL
jgi:hypothetical protein